MVFRQDSVRPSPAQHRWMEEPLKGSAIKSLGVPAAAFLRNPVLRPAPFLSLHLDRGGRFPLAGDKQN